MQYYNNINDHIQLVLSGLSRDLNIDIIDRTEINIDTGNSAYCYTIGDIEPMGINTNGQQINEIEIEIQLYIPTSKNTNNTPAQLYAVGVSSKICELLISKYYGLSDQRLKPEIQSNAALEIKGASSAKKSVMFVGRSVIFKQIVYVGPSNIGLYDLQITGVMPHE